MASVQSLAATPTTGGDGSGAAKELLELTGVPDNCPLRLDRSPELGRFLVAARDLSEGEVLLRESPLVLGPQPESAPLCLGCHRPIGFAAPHMCSRCGSALLCSPGCETSPYHARECVALRDALPFSTSLLLGDDANWQVVMPLRCFVNQPKGIFQMESHLEARRLSGAYNECEKNVVRVLHDHGLLRNFPEQAIQKICGILDVNSFEVRGPADETGRSECLRGIYPNAAFMAHSCIQNTHVAIATDFTLIVKAATKISQGEKIFYNYSDTLMCTAMRREHLRLGKYFSCECRRCMDPTELGSHLSSLHCPEATCLGAVVCDDPLRPAEVSWRCETCRRMVDPAAVHVGLMGVQRELALMDRTDTGAMEALLSTLKRSLHPQHAATLEVTQALSGLYREQLMDLGPTAPPAILRRKLELCCALLPPVERLEPTLSRLRGITLYEMASPLVALAQQSRGAGGGAAEAAVQLERAEVQLREAARLLLNEPPGAPEAQLARVALLELRAVRQDLADLAKATKKAAAKGKGRKKK